MVVVAVRVVEEEEEREADSVGPRVSVARVCETCSAESSVERMDVGKERV